eukprot:SAG31_NODE_4483_length_3196_cov_36.451082_1_plen_92_part_10
MHHEYAINTAQLPAAAPHGHAVAIINSLARDHRRYYSCVQMSVPVRWLNLDLTLRACSAACVGPREPPPPRKPPFLKKWGLTGWWPRDPGTP